MQNLDTISAKRPIEIGSVLHGAGKEPSAKRDQADSQYSIKRILVMDDE